MTGFVVTVTFRIEPEFRGPFRDAILANSSTSVRDEPGCSVFDVCEKADGSEIFLYEIYDDEAAFKAHLATDHFKRFDAQVGPWVVDKRIVTFNRLNSGN